MFCYQVTVNNLRYYCIRIVRKHILQVQLFAVDRPIFALNAEIVSFPRKDSVLTGLDEECAEAYSAKDESNDDEREQDSLPCAFPRFQILRIVTSLVIGHV